LVLGSWWLVVGGWWVGATTGSRTSDPAVHQPPVTNHQTPITAQDTGASPAAARPSVAWVSPATDSLARPAAPLVPTPAVVHGLYVNRWAAIGAKVWQLIGLARQTGINAFVIDVKDDRGFVLYHSRVALAHEIGADTVRPLGRERMRALLDTLRSHHIYPIARIVVAKDPLLASRRPAWAIRSRNDPTVAWHDRQGRPWVDANQRGVWEYAVDLAREAVDYGFSEVQFDYVRFPDDKNLMREATFPLAHGRTRAQVIREQLGFVHAALTAYGVPMSADVFGLTASDTTDMGIGQRWEMFVDQLDVVSPMSYPSHYAPGTYHLQDPNAHPYAVIDHTLKDAARRSAGIPHAATVRPWYQDFTLGPPHYGPAEVRAQMQAGYANGVQSWLLWNPGSRYSAAELVAPSPTPRGR
jgi:hypothetical protein